MTKHIRNIGLFLISAILYGQIEAFIFNHGFHTGAMDFFHLLKAGYHLPMAGLMLIVAWATDAWVFIPLWVLLEDICFWIYTGQELTRSSWVSMGFGGFVVFGAYLPWTYVGLLGLFGVFLFLRWVANQISFKFEL